MKKRPIARLLLLLLGTAICLVAVATLPQTANPTEADTIRTNELEVEIMDFSHETENVIYLAGGCFWGMEQLMQSIPGVIDAESDLLTAPGSRMPTIRQSAPETPVSGKR